MAVAYHTHTFEIPTETIEAAQSTADTAVANAATAQATADDALVLATAAQGFASRAALAATTVDAAVNYVRVYHDGISYLYERDSSGTAISSAGGQNWSPIIENAVIPIGAWGAVVDGATDCQPAAQAAADWAIAQDIAFTLKMNKGGQWKFADEVDMSASTKEITVAGCGRAITDVLPTAFGANKAIFRFPAGVPCNWYGFKIDGDLSNNDYDHPIGIYLPSATQSYCWDFDCSSLGNTTIWSSRNFNSQWDFGRISFTGYQPVWKTIPTSTTLTMIAGNAFLLCSSAVFSSGDVNKRVLIQVTDNSDGNEAIAVTINAVPSSGTLWAGLPEEQAIVSGTVIEVSAPMPFSDTGRRFSFTPVRGTITGTTLIAQKSIFTGTEEGRWIYLPGAGANGGWHVSRVDSYTSGTTIELEDAAIVDGTYEILFVPQVWLGPQEATGTPINDIRITGSIEGYRGIGIGTDRGTHVRMNDLKIHGRAFGGSNGFADFGMCWNPAILGGTTRCYWVGGEIEFCGGAQQDGLIRLIGDSPSLIFDNVLVAAPVLNCGLFWFDPSDLTKSALVIGNVLTRNDAYLQGSWINTTTRAQRQRVFMTGAFVSEAGKMPSVIFPSSGTNRITLAANSVYTFNPSSDTGYMRFVEDSISTVRGMVYFRSTASPLMVAESPAMGTDVVLTTGVITPGGTADKLTISVTSGAIYLRNSYSSALNIAFEVMQ